MPEEQQPTAKKEALITMSLTNDIKQFALSQGAQLVAMTPVETYTDYLAEVEKRLKETGAQSQDFMISPVPDMPNSKDMSFFTHLSDGRRTMPTARSIIVLAVYAYDESAIYKDTRRELRGKTARTYVYYPVVRQIAESVVSFIKDRGYRAIQGQHVPLKFVAERIGLGAYGKNGILQTAEYGSYIALRDILTDAELEPDDIEAPPALCQGCEKCIKACPTGALYAPYKVNPALCINPVSRRDASIEPEIRSKMQNWVHGCDICQEVCPANRHLKASPVDPRARFDPSHHASHRNLDGLERTPELLTLLAPNQPDILRRNAAIALANTGKGKSEALQALKEQLGGSSSELNDYFTWAIDELERKQTSTPIEGR